MFRKPPQQEMQQMRETGQTSPFWRTASANSQRGNNDSTKGASTPEKERKVIGASYSHADILKFDELSLSSTSRPRTPPSLPRNKSTPPPKSQGIYTPPRRGYSSFLSSANDTYDSLSDAPRPDPEDALVYASDEDEFGLPSLSSMRRKQASKRAQKQKGSTSSTNGFGSTYQNGGTGSTTSLHPQPASWALDNGDIATERTIPTYPSTHPHPSGGKILRPQYKDILADPANALHLIAHPSLPASASPQEHDAHAARTTRINKFKRILQASSISLPDLRASAWSGLPPEVRAMSWQVLLGYLPTSASRRVDTLERKRREYREGVRQAFQGSALNPNPNATPGTPPSRGGGTTGRGLDEAIWHQISIDVPRTNPHLELYSYEATQRSLERILYLWALRHPASGYVQGISDLATPFFQVFLASYITPASSSDSIESGFDPGQLPKAVLDAVEADTYFCLTKLLEGIQDNYVHLQPGITRQVAALRDLVARIDGGLAGHLEREGVEFLQFSFRWMNCLLMREVSVRCVVRMWDTYLAEDTPTPFATFHLYVCAAFLVKWSSQIQKMEFQEIMMFLQALPTRDWTEKDVELLLSEAFIWKSLFEGARAHVVKTKDNFGGMMLGG